MLQVCDERLGLPKRLAACGVDPRQKGRIEHSIQDLVRRRLFAIACRYADCNDATRLAEDPIQRLPIGRDSLKSAMPALQPTLSRFENAPWRSDLYRMGEALAETVIERHRRRWGGEKVKHVTLDLDLTHAGQSLIFFNGHYRL